MMLVHILGGSIAIVAGFVALFVTKGQSAHRASGAAFVYAMVVMGVSGALIAVIRAIPGSVIAGFLAAYFAVTAATTMRRPGERRPRLDASLAAAGFMIGTGNLAIGTAAAAGMLDLDGVPVAMPFIFGAIAILAGVGDVRVLRSGGVRGTKRLRRHIWRVCFALFIASGSFFLGQADELPAQLRIFPLLAIPAFAPLVAMPYWLWRVRARKARLTPTPAEALHAAGAG